MGKDVGKNIYYINIIVTRAESAKSDPFFDELQRAVEVEIRKNTCLLSKVWMRPNFSNHEKYSSADIDELIRELFPENGPKSDGIIIIGACSPKIIKALSQQCRNIVSINRDSTNYDVDEVVCSGKRIAEVAIDYLIELGHRKIGYVGGTHNKSRFDGYVETLVKHKISLNPDYVYKAELSEESGYSIMDEIMHKDDVPTGIYCSNDIIAVGMLKCLSKYKNRYYLPSIISADDINEAQYTKPMLTTVRIPKDEMAMFALELLLNRINGSHRSAVKLEIGGTLVVRGSCYNADNAMSCEYFI